MTSFSSRVKNEVAKLPLEKSCCSSAEMLALFRMSGSMILERGLFGGLFQTKSPAIAQRFLQLIRQSAFDLLTETGIQKTMRLQRTSVYQVKLIPSEESVLWLREMGILGSDGFNSSKDKGFVKKQCCRRAYLRGAFLGGGSVNKPEGRYHLELASMNEAFIDFIQELIGKFELNAKIAQRNEEYVVYLKEGDSIIHFLQIVGANEALLNFENVRIIKERREYANRTMNCEVANVQKTVDAAFRHLEVIRKLDEEDLMERLPLSLRETAMMRLRFPEESLKDLAERFSTPLSKSGLNHRLNKLEKAGKEILDKYGVKKE